MIKVLVIGAGEVGSRGAARLGGTGDFVGSLAAGDADALQRGLPQGVTATVANVEDRAGLDAALAGQDVVFSACPFYLSLPIAEAAKEAGIHFLDLTEDVDTARRIRELANGSEKAFIPQCGLAPGFISIVAYDLIDRFDEPYDVRLRVGALPQFPDNALKYNLTWSTEGLINEYCNPSEAIYNGEKREVLPLEGLEEFSLDGVRYEAFSTAGGVGTLCEALQGRVRNLN